MKRRYNADFDSQLQLPFGPIRNSLFFSNHWLDNRLRLEPEWQECRERGIAVHSALQEIWSRERTRVHQYGNESQLEYAFIQPVLEALGWKLIYQVFLRGRKPDYALFVDEETQVAGLKVGTDSLQFWKFPTLVADSKAWDRPLDRRTGVHAQREYPPEQIEWYLNNSQLNYGILTNGRIWRLIPRVLGPDQHRFQTYLECDLPNLLEGSEHKAGLFDEVSRLEQFMRFYLFFSPVAYSRVADRTPLLERARTGSTEYRLGVGADLRGRVFEALRLSIQGFLRFEANNLDPARDLELCREQSFVLLYRILFVMYAEDRQLLPYRINRLYTDNRALGRYRREIAARLDLLNRPHPEDFSPTGTAIWDDLVSLFDLIDAGHRRYGVPPYNGGLFSSEPNEFLTTKKIDDWHLARIIDQMGRAYDDQHPEFGLYPVDYRDLQIQHLGNIYEGLLELHPHFTGERMMVIRPKERSRWSEEQAVSAKEAVPTGYESTGIFYEPGDVYLVTDKGERRATGSYYTPDQIVNYIIEKTLQPLCRQIDERLRNEISEVDRSVQHAIGPEKARLEGELERLKGDYDERILRLAVLDPAMGSGHFLLRACQYLAEEIATHPYASDPFPPNDSSAASAVTFWKRRVVENCIYGVDRNALAVELAKLALWLETVAIGQPLTFIDHRLRHGDSLVGANIQEIGSLRGEGSLFDLSAVVREEIPQLLDPIRGIEELSSDTPDHVREKEQLLRKFHKARRRFVDVADTWCASFYLRDPAMPVRYAELIRALRNQSRFKHLREEESIRRALSLARQRDMSFFHWELEFPEIFLSPDHPRGFNAIVGNPPYDVLSEKEIGHDISGFKAYVDAQPRYEPSRRGKNNLYKLFVCRGVDLLGEDARLGLILPMALLGDDQAAEIRRLLFQQGSLSSIDAFPQKDDPTRRIFAGAKLATAIVIFAKTADAVKRASPFLCRVHPTNQIEPDSPSLELSADEIPLYDDTNLPIVSCSQEDWDIAARIMKSGRMKRLGQCCGQYQGEVNETIERKRGAISKRPADGPLILRGSNVCLYVVREASQGEPLHLKVSRFLQDRSSGGKAYHFKERRLGFQRSSPQNNFRRIVASIIEKGNHCFDTISYVRESDSQLPLEFVLGLLNSKVLDWYFRLGSTNSKVNEYQFKNLPCPVFADKSATKDVVVRDEVIEALKNQNIEEALELVEPLLKDPPFSPVIVDIVADAARRIVDAEGSRGRISRKDRSELAPAAQPFQNFIDRILFATAGLTDSEIRGVEERLRTML